MSSTPRRQFLHASAALVAAGVFTSRVFGQETAPPPPGVGAAPPKPPALPSDKVQAAVAHAHGNLEKLRALIEDTPLLVNACWDWGGGDFETPLQAAAHTGRREIAEYLLAHYARLDLYAAAMLGQLDLIKAALAPDPVALAAVPGPHGFTLLHCARQGGAPAKPVVDWLLAAGVSDVRQQPLPFRWPGEAGDNT